MTTRRYFTLMVALWVAATSGHALAQGRAAATVDATALYTVEVPLEPGASNARVTAYEQALEEVLIRMTGSEPVALSPEVRALFPEPDRYVLRFRPGAEESLVVTLDGQAIEALLREAGHPVWGADRPLTLVWLAVDWGQGDREIVAGGDPVLGVGSDDEDRNGVLRERLEAAAQRRGLPILFPLLDTQDLEQVSSSDVWGGFDETLLEASRRYGTSSILVGRVRANAATRGRWSYYSATQRLEWSGAPEDVVAALAETFAEEFAYAGGSVESVTLTVSGVDSVAAYGRVQSLLGGLNVIDSYRLHSVAGADMSFEVEVRGGSERLAAALDFSGVLRRADWLGVQDFLDPRAQAATLGYLYLSDESPPVGQSEILEPQDARSAGGTN